MSQSELSGETDSNEETRQVLEVEDASSYYGSAMALSDISFTLADGEVVGVVGPNGAGKSTLLDCITGFKDFDGTIRYRGESVAGLEPWEMSHWVGYATEDGNLFGDMTVLQNLKAGAHNKPEQESENLNRVMELFPRLDERQEQRAKTLSGGEKQMLSIGRSLMADPSLLLLDEPSLGLAPIIIDDISEALTDIIDGGTTVLLCEQNISLAQTHADQLLLLEHGQIAERGTPAEFETDDRIRETYLGGE
jgi:branched-chain amino acid transport system ATP-binding protein